MACTLTPGDAVERREAWGRLARAALIDRARSGNGVTLRFRAGAEHELRALVAAERECCPFLTLQVREDGDGLTLEITGPQYAAPVLDAFAGVS
jgi:hypothetical protein